MIPLLCAGFPEWIMMLTMRWSIATLLFTSIAGGQTCTVPDTSCVEAVVVGSHRLSVFRTHSIHSGTPDVVRAFIMVHGVQRNANTYFRTALNSTTLAGQLENTLVIAPHFKGNDGSGCYDSIAENELNFPCDGWTDGQAATNAKMTSFGAIDQLLSMLADKEKFPKLKEIVVAGHSSGAQFAQRYAASNRIDPDLPVAIRYVVANPSSYVYLDSWRPEADRCADYDDYRYGLKNLSGYIVETGLDAVRKNYPLRDVTYLLGELDTRNAYHMDTSCGAMAQGPHRMARGQAFFKRLNETYPSKHNLLVVPGCVHNADCMYRSEIGRNTVFKPGR